MSVISIIVPVYKVEKYLSRCVDSILAQSFADYQLILVDDGSPDACGRICDDYASKDNRIHVIHQENGGISAARNAGLDWVFEHTDSQWLTFVDSDDWIHPELMERLLKMAQEHHSKISVCGYQLTNGAISDPLSGEDKVWDTEAFFVQRNVNATVPWGKLYHRELFRNMRYPLGNIHEDEYITYQILFSQDTIPVVDRPVYYYYYNYVGISKSNWSIKRLDAHSALKAQVDFFQSNGYLQAYELAATNYAARLLSDGKNLAASDLPDSVKRARGRIVRRELRAVLWKHRAFYLRKERGVYVEAFPAIAAAFRFLKSLFRRSGTGE